LAGRVIFGLLVTFKPQDLPKQKEAAPKGGFRMLCFRWLV